MTETLTQFIKKTALEIGFDACGIAKATHLEQDAAYLKEWLDKGYNGDMHFMENNFEKRVDPTLLVPQCKSIIVVALNYYPQKFQSSNVPKIAKYAYSKTDYHYVLKAKLKELEERIISKTGISAFTVDQQHSFVDSAPVLERRWAQVAGLGWIGKNKQLIVDKKGSYYFIGTLMTSIELEYDESVKDRCGSCTRCIDACPTNALDNGILNATKCISYHTIESKAEIPDYIVPKLSNNMLGCDICADVCPWNKKWTLASSNSLLDSLDEIVNWTTAEWASLTASSFKKTFKNTALNRAGHKKIRSNLNALTHHDKQKRDNE